MSNKKDIRKQNTANGILLNISHNVNVFNVSRLLRVIYLASLQLNYSPEKLGTKASSRFI